MKYLRPRCSPTELILWQQGLIPRHLNRFAGVGGGGRGGLSRVECEALSAGTYTRFTFSIIALSLTAACKASELLEPPHERATSFIPDSNQSSLFKPSWSPVYDLHPPPGHPTEGSVHCPARECVPRGRRLHLLCQSFCRCPGGISEAKSRHYSPELVPLSLHNWPGSKETEREFGRGRVTHCEREKDYLGI